MAFLKLENINKIYSSSNSVAIGIQKVNLEFELGEFVAITGKSGSGKTTLLNVMSGLDNYDNGEMYIEGEQTSHYLSKEWEDYRQKYISFIFQDYNILESFTVLENVEFALLHITDLKQRREKAIELLNKVGLSSCLKQKGSKLSGGQKQRTVIARALAKDSPIIFADEPTGNLDAQSSKEILALLAEISKQKLVVVVTHNSDQVAEYATREIRIFDGIIGSDEKLSEFVVQNVEIINSGEIKKPVRESFLLGFHKFLAQPKLSTFLCTLFTIAALSVFMVTSIVAFSFNENHNSKLFTYKNGRLILFKQNEQVFTQQEIDELTKLYGCDYLKYDSTYDFYEYIKIYTSDREDIQYYPLSTTKSYYAELWKDDIKPDIGRAPQGDDEIFLYAPISDKLTLFKRYGKTLVETVVFCNYEYKLAGVKFYYDNTKPAYALFSEGSFKKAAMSTNINKPFVRSSYDSYNEPTNKGPQIFISKLLKGNESIGYKDSNLLDTFSATVKDKTYTLEPKTVTTEEFSNSYKNKGDHTENSLYISEELAELILNNSQTRLSLVFANDNIAKNKIQDLTEKGYLALLSDATFTREYQTVDLLMNNIMYSIVWVMVIVFMALFVSLCSTRVNESGKKDVAIFRTMGIKAKIIKLSIMWQNLFAMIPPIIITAIVATLIFLSPNLNSLFAFLHFGEYFAIFLGIIGIALLISWRFNKKLFKQTVRKNLRGGKKHDKA